MVVHIFFIIGIRCQVFIYRSLIFIVAYRFLFAFFIHTFSILAPRFRYAIISIYWNRIHFDNDTKAFCIEQVGGVVVVVGRWVSLQSKYYKNLQRLRSVDQMI